MTNPAIRVQEFGQSLWLDYINRKELDNGTFQKRLDDGVLGVTSNPSIFQQVIGETETYDEKIKGLLHLDANGVYETVAIADIQTAADMMRGIYDRTNKVDGYVSFEVSPLIARSTAETISEAVRLFKLIDRANLMIKIPATPEGLPAIEEAIYHGINVNVTLIFSVKNYEQVAEAFIKGLERRMAEGKPVSGIASVASFFLSRIDSAVDKILENNIRAAQITGDTQRIAQNRVLLGQMAVANAKLAYRAFEKIFYGARFSKLAGAGAMVQRPLWASTGTKNASYSDTMYVDLLIGKDTVNTLPPKTLLFFIDHGTASNSIGSELGESLDPQEVMNKLAELGIEIDLVTQRLQDDGVDLFTESFEKLMDQVEAKTIVMKAGVMNGERYLTALGIYAEDVNKTITELDKAFVNGRMWGKDGTIWKEHSSTIAKIQNRLGWLDVLKTIDIQRIASLRASMKNSDITHVVLLGMGGSSLAPEVLYKTFGKQEGYPELMVLDSTDPARIRDVEQGINLAKSLFIVASKSGGTVETLSFYKYFYALTKNNAKQFIAITDPGSELAQDAQAKGFREIFLNPEDIGGRYSALSYFGLVPVALVGIDVERLWASAQLMIETSGEKIPGAQHPGVALGAVIGTLAKLGRDKLTIVTSTSISSYGDWVEQLVAESIGKEGKGIVPVVGATVGKPHDYLSDRLFVYLRVDGDADIEDVDNGVRALREAGHPRVTLRLPDAYAIAGEFFRWEFATAIAGHLYSINPFDEPNVTEAKDATKALLKVYETDGTLPNGTPFVSSERSSLYLNEYTLAPLRELCVHHGFNINSRSELLAAQITGSQAGDYFAILAYLNPTPAIDSMLRDVQRRLRHVSKRAVTVGFGPRYLHSTGQMHKGGSHTGIFFVLTTNVEQDIAIPDAPYSFGTLYQAQALGDIQALENHKCRVIRIHIDDNIEAGMNRLLAAIDFVEERRS
jgi:transaldolase / glucose-6-phosphate isomerase